ncbi:NAD(P)/FAD-dependent oxidoreductase [Salinicola rhizosphaerae]|uniref:Pyridine nucleotide-disulfide oxidoreductase n=1 Tax=Salinicola rhizosphaerae TaxID=1443141 RepID=A0ABQ3E0H2_9GAMM|nr:FAD-dependent oxidoreductase [Salinicola rhizosphaerae]GHB21705.1 pyridine nucleotide-disulfide oxidoreductase [Salinicola rhizosphaerae]
MTGEIAAPSKPTAESSAPIEHLVIIGNGMAGHRLISELAGRSDRPRRISVIGEEPATAYNRILLSPWLAGEIEREALDLPVPVEAVTSHLNERVIDIDRKHRTLRTQTGRTLDYDRLVIATGSRATRPAVPGTELANVGAFRTLADAEWMAARTSGDRAVVVGGGLLGLEAAEGLRKRGLEVTVLQRGSRLMNRQLDATAAEWLRETLTARGLKIETGATLARCEGDAEGRVSAVVLSDGRRLPANCVVFAAGITPNVELGRQAGLVTERGIVVDHYLTTSDPAIHALGECCEHRGASVGLVEPIWQQVETLADVLCQRPATPYAARECATRLKVGGISLYAFGPTDETPGDEILAYADAALGDYRRLLLRDGRLVGAVLYGDSADGPALFRLAQSSAVLPEPRDALLFGAADLDPLSTPQPLAQNLQRQKNLRRQEEAA